MNVHDATLNAQIIRRFIEPIAMPDIAPAPIITKAPRPARARPVDLVVDETYQRDLSKRSIDLIRKIVANWDWSRFKPPIVVETDDGYEVIDGQHTAIAAASHPEIKEIPVMIVDAAEISDRARAFLGHNRDRVQITRTQMHHAAVAAKDEDAQTIEQVCERAGVRILRVAPGNGSYRPADTMAVSSIAALINRSGAMRARQVLQVLAKAMCAPIRADEIKAAELLMTADEFKNTFRAEELTLRVRSMGEEAFREAKIFAATHKIPLWRALASVWYKGMKRVRRPS